MAHQLPVALRLALLGTAQHGEQLADRLARQHGLEEQDRLADAIQVHVKIGLGEAEDDADIRFGLHDGVDQHAAVGVLQGDDQRDQEVPADDPAHDVGARHLVENRADDLDPDDGAPLVDLLEIAGHFRCDVGDAAVEVAPRRVKADVTQHILEQQQQRAVIEIGVGADRGGDLAQRVEIRGDELDFGRDTDGAEQPARGGAEKGLGEFRIRQCFHQQRKLIADLCPQLPIERLLPQLQAQLRNGLADEPVVQLDTLDGIALTALPVAGIEAPGRAAGNDPKLRVVIRECCNDEVSAVCGWHASSRSRWAGLCSDDARTAARSGTCVARPDDRGGRSCTGKNSTPSVSLLSVAVPPVSSHRNNNL